ncbi:hypothetical protein GQ53DRAFT_821039 [Thozetella sp. PMI_491]|nr:hypothetical protein GQ53DRAFT_821039 [Thozetella sp. PMI_491]
MRTSLLLSCLWLLAPLTEAFKERGGAERYLMWLTYIAEEIFEDGKSYTIATGCVGTRTGLRGQLNRCDLIEFCNHIWKATPDPKGNLDSIPPRELQAWPSETKIKTGWDFPFTSVAGWINTVKQKETPDAKKSTKIKGAGFTGFLDSEKLLGGPANWYTMFGEWGKRLSAPQAEMNLVWDSLDDFEKPAFKRLMAAKIPNAAKYAATLRLQDRHKNWINPSPGHKSFKEVFGHDVVVEKYTIDKALTDGKTVQFDFINRDKTAELIKGDFGGDANKAAAAFDATVADINNKDIGFDGKPFAHQRAMDVFEQIEQDVKKISAPCG